jgi:hypothetical protein
VHRSNTFWSVGSVERTPRLLNTLRKEGFARVHQQRKGDALILLEGLKEKPSEGLNEHKECTKDTVSSYYKLRRKSVKFPGDYWKVRRRTQEK